MTEVDYPIPPNRQISKEYQKVITKATAKIIIDKYSQREYPLPPGRKIGRSTSKEAPHQFISYYKYIWILLIGLIDLERRANGDKHILWEEMNSISLRNEP
jgi:hypothetical protein